MSNQLKGQFNRRLKALLMFLLMLPLAWNAGATEAGNGTGAGANTTETLQSWLTGLAPALEKTSYRGVFFYARGDDAKSMAVFHRYQDGNVRERLVLQDGDSGEILRNGNQIICILPNQRPIQLDSVIPTGAFADAFRNDATAILRWYTARQLADDRVAGYDAVVIALTAKDVHRFSYRFWLEKKTGLLIRTQILDEKGGVIERFQYTSLELTDAISDQELSSRAQGLVVTQHVLPANANSSEAVAPAPMGWRLGWRPDGFEPAVASRDRQAAFGYSDGLASFSVFVEPMGATDMPTGASRIGATTAYMRKVTAAGKIYLVTVVGELPPDTAMKVAESVVLTE